MKATYSKSALLVCEILNALFQASGEMGVSELAKTLGCYPSKIHRIVSTLENKGILEKDANTKKYRVGLFLFEIGGLYYQGLDFINIAKPHAYELAKKYEMDVSLGILSRTIPYKVAVVDKVFSFQSDSSIRRATFNIPIHSSSLGKTIVAFSDEKKRTEIFRKIELKKFTSNTITDLEEFKKEIEIIQSRGYAFDQGETHINLYCTGAPIYNQKGLLGAISISGKPVNIKKRKDKMISDILEKADVISFQLGYKY